MPVVAICRGMQYINGALGGKVSLLTNLQVARPVGQEHPIVLNGEVVMINNYHNDGIYRDFLSKKLTPIGMDVENDVVEVYESKTLRILGIQGHPERAISDGVSRQIIDGLIRNFVQ
jgi:putative glutamine amidotransferase